MQVCLGAIEAGGTKFVCAVGTGPTELLEETTFPTTSPTETLERAASFFKEAAARQGKLSAIGIASFGPVDLRPDSASYGFITTTPKAGWQQTEFAGLFARAFDVPVGFDTDVNAAALAEWRWGAARGKGSCLYVTVGTGIGGGFVVGGRTLKGLLHPEMGHVRVSKRSDDPFEGNCPFHGDACLEGLASGPALERRWKQNARDWAADHPGWALEADYLAQAIVNWILTLSPEVVVLGGGVMQQRHLFPPIRARVTELLAGYLQVPEVLESRADYIQPPALGERSGVLGALALAKNAPAIP